MSAQSFGTNEYKEWILKHPHEDFDIAQNRDNQILLNNEAGVAEILFYDDDLVEISIVSRKDNQLKYYLHFQIQDEEHAKELFEEMAQALSKMTSEKKIKVLFSCTSGATTTYFAEKLNEVVRDLELDYSFSAIPYTKLYEESDGYDVIVLAPQIGYMYKKLKSALSDKLVLQFPTAVFAAFDSLETLEFIRKEVQEYRHSNARKSQQPKCSRISAASGNILTIGVILEPEYAQCYYRLYQNGTAILDDFAKIPCFCASSLEDMIRHAMTMEKNIDVIALGLPGVVAENQKSYQLPKRWERGRRVDLVKSIQDKFHIPVFLVNNSNAAAQGLSLRYPQYKNLSYYSLSRGFFNGGIGSVVNGDLVYGKSGIAGEVYVFTERMQYSNFPRKLGLTDIGQLEVVTNTILPLIGILGPEVLFLRTPMVNDMEELHHHLKDFVQEDAIPELHYIFDISNDLLSGVLALCLKHQKPASLK